MENIKIESKPKVLAWVTSPLTAKQILTKAYEFASRESFEVVAVSVQGPISDDWAAKSRDLVVLEKCAREIGAQLIVEFSDNQLKTAFDLISNFKPVTMFTGVPGTGRSTAFISNIRQMADVQVFTVDKNGNMLSFE